jgi:hypothetical protein
VRPLIAGVQSPAMNEAREASGSGGGKSKSGSDGDDKWSREGLFRFTFEIQPLDKSGATKLGTKGESAGSAPTAAAAAEHLTCCRGARPCLLAQDEQLGLGPVRQARHGLL